MQDWISSRAFLAPEDGAAAGGGEPTGAVAPADGAAKAASEPAVSDAGAPSAAEGSSGVIPLAPPAAPQPPTGSAQAEAPKGPSKSDWRDAKIAKLTARLREAQSLRPPSPTAAAVDPLAGPMTQQQIDAMVNERAALLAQQNEFNRRCNEMATAGMSEDPAFMQKVNGIQGIVDSTDPRAVQTYNALLEAALETGAGHKVLAKLGDDLNEAARILSLSPVKMGIELAKIAMQDLAEPQRRATPQVSAAPKPIKPISGRTSHENAQPDDPEEGTHIDIKEWMNRRERQVAERAKAAGRA